MSQSDETKRLLDHAFHLLAAHDVMRYLICNTRHRANGYEKAKTHTRLVCIFIALYLQVEIDEVQYDCMDLYEKMHDHTQILTSHLDTIGFPTDDQMPDYDRIAPKFTKRYLELCWEFIDDRGL